METLKDVANNILDKNIENDFGIVAKSSVKLIKNSRGLGWEIKVVTGEENLIDGLMEKAVEVHKKLEVEFKEVEK